MQIFVASVRIARHDDDRIVRENRDHQLRHCGVRSGATITATDPAISSSEKSHPLGFIHARLSRAAAAACRPTRTQTPTPAPPGTTTSARHVRLSPCTRGRSARSVCASKRTRALSPPLSLSPPHGRPVLVDYTRTTSPRLASPHLASPNLTSSHLTSPHLTSPHLTSPHLTSPHLTSPHFISPHLTSPHLTSPRHASPRLASPHLASPHLTSPHLTSPHLTSPHLTSPHLTSPHLISPHLASPHLTRPHLTSPRLASLLLASPRLTSPHLASPRLTSPHLASSRRASSRLQRLFDDTSFKMKHFGSQVESTLRDFSLMERDIYSFRVLKHTQIVDFLIVTSVRKSHKYYHH